MDANRTTGQFFAYQNDYYDDNQFGGTLKSTRQEIVN